ncbi:MAG: dephospho-CoA kinase [Candidatus Fimimonas sp.]
MKRKVIALTGGIGSGKSTVAEILRGMGFVVLDCDKIAAEVSHEKQLLAEVSALLGKDCVADGKLQRKVVRERVFGNDALYKQYCNLFWERTKNALACQLNGLDGTIFVEIAVFDAFVFAWDEVWLVQSEKQTRLQRVTARDGVSEQNVLEIMSKQNYPCEVTCVIQNDGNLDDLKTAVLSALKNLK